uniref:Choline transporter-like protein n=1 Tax=Phasianus colchicus TaxID=9054 RepID=A0A669QPC2_PHACC
PKSRPPKPPWGSRRCGGGRSPPSHPRVVVLDKVTDFLLFLGKLLIVGGVGVLAFFFFTHRIKLVEDTAPTLNYYWVPILVSGAGGGILGGWRGGDWGGGWGGGWGGTQRDPQQLLANVPVGNGAVLANGGWLSGVDQWGVGHQELTNGGWPSGVDQWGVGHQELTNGGWPSGVGHQELTNGGWPSVVGQ